MVKPGVWVVDDDDSTRAYLWDFLSSRGYDVQCLDSGEQVIRRLASAQRPSLLILDIHMPHVGGLEVLAQMDKLGRRIPAIVLSGIDQVSTVVRAMRLGASDYLLKPLDEKELELAIEKVLEEHGNGDSLDLELPTPETAFPSSNKRMLQIKAICDHVAYTDVPVLILGESGAGKEVLARYLHTQSGRNEMFVKVNCAALPTELLESELFGHERGAFTGALREKPGKFELAGQGTIMLDEIAEMSPLLQAKLLHVLQDGEYSRLGGTKTLRSEARLIAATNKRLHNLVATGEFREDLYFRLNVITIEVPPLRERPEDIGPLCERFVEKYRAKYKSNVKRLPEELQHAFARFSWPGNVRQLENAVKRFLILPDLQLTLAELRESGSQRDIAPQGSFSLKELSSMAAERAEKELILRTLDEVNWNRKLAARRLNICYKSLLNKLRRWQLRGRSEVTANRDVSEDVYTISATGSRN
ncbi:MAG: sigma-54-dependent Fis family transcriptional regulator [Acidobacteria bacterium]|nr:MAG: sigma-54-dependent Fis family transcriptional regulator [Acidobacteriota bacterium]